MIRNIRAKLIKEIDLGEEERFQRVQQAFTLCQREFKKLLDISK